MLEDLPRAADDVARGFVARRDAVPETSWLIGLRFRGGPQRGSAKRQVLEWARTDDPLPLLIIGGYGAGKSTLVAAFTAQLLSDWLRGDPAGGYPILCPLAHWNTSANLRDRIAAGIESMGFPGETSLVDLRDALGRLVLVLDGLDEWRPELSGREVSELFREIAATTGPAHHLIVTSRSPVFLRSDQAWGMPDAALRNVAGLERTRRLYRIKELASFTPKERQRYVRRRLARESPDLEERVATTYPMSDLAKRPLFLRMIVDARAKLTQRGRSINLWQLYSHWVSDVFARRAGHGADPEDLAAICERVAVRLFSERRGALPGADVRALAEDLPTVSAGPPGVAELLVDRHGDTMAFAHRSLYHYWVARAVIRAIRERRRGLLGHGLMPQEVVAFVAQGTRSELTQSDLAWLAGTYARTGRRSTWTRINTLQLLAAAAPNQLRLPLLDSLQSGELAVRTFGLKLAGYHRVRGVKAALSPSLAHEDRGVRYLAVEAAGLTRSTAAAPQVLAAVADPSPEVRSVALWAFRKIRAPEFEDFALELLQASQPRPVQAAAQVLGMRRVARARSALAERRASGDLDSWNADHVDAAIRAIDARDTWSPSALARLARLQEGFADWLDGDPPTWQVVYALEIIGERRYRQRPSVLMVLAQDASTLVRHAAVDAIGELRDTSYVPFLARRYRGEPDPRVRGDVIWALGNIGDVHGLDAVRAASEDPHDDVRRWSDWARRQFGESLDDGWGARRFVYPSVGDRT